MMDFLTFIFLNVLMKRQPLTNVDYKCIVYCKTNCARLPPLTTSIPIKSRISGGIFLGPDVGWMKPEYPDLGIVQPKCS